jgi:DNA-binding CsgD family transcriptional regulator
LVAGFWTDERRLELARLVVEEQAPSKVIAERFGIGADQVGWAIYRFGLAGLRARARAARILELGAAGKSAAEISEALRVHRAWVATILLRGRG